MAVTSDPFRTPTPKISNDRKFMIWVSLWSTILRLSTLLSPKGYRMSFGGRFFSAFAIPRIDSRD